MQIRNSSLVQLRHALLMLQPPAQHAPSSIVVTYNNTEAIVVDPHSAANIKGAGVRRSQNFLWSCIDPLDPGQPERALA